MIRLKDVRGYERDFEIYYDLPTASGIWVTHIVIAHGEKEAEDICRKIESVGYKLKMVN